jgi:hypothetical protein
VTLDPHHLSTPHWCVITSSGISKMANKRNPNDPGDPDFDPLDKSGNPPDPNLFSPGHPANEEGGSIYKLLRDAEMKGLRPDQPPAEGGGFDFLKLLKKLFTTVGQGTGQSGSGHAPFYAATDIPAAGGSAIGKGAMAGVSFLPAAGGAATALNHQLPPGQSQQPPNAQKSTLDKLLEEYQKSGKTDYTQYGLMAASLLAQLFGGEGSPMDDIVDSSDPRARFLNPKDVLSTSNRSIGQLGLGVSRKAAAPTTIAPPPGMEGRLGTYTQPGLDTSAGDMGDLNGFLENFVNPAQHPEAATGPFPSPTVGGVKKKRTGPGFGGGGF